MESKEEIKSQTEVTINTPKKILHFSDGIDEEFEETDVSTISHSTKDSVDPKTLSWGPWLSYYTWQSGTKVLSTVDYVGEGLANFFGITTPKYQLEIDEYERLEAENKAIEEESAGWVDLNAGTEAPLVLMQPGKGEETPHKV